MKRMKWLVYLIALFAIAVLNYGVLGQLPISRPLLLPMAAVAVGLREGCRFGAGFGLLCGLLLTSMGHESLLCISLLSALGWVCGWLAQRILRRDLAGFFTLAISVLMLRALYQVLIRLPYNLTASLKAAFGEMLWTMIFALPLYGIFQFFCQRYGRLSHG